MLAFLLACASDPISNRLFFEDQEFLDALPSAEHHRVDYVAERAAEDDDDDELVAPSGAPELLVLTVASVVGVNKLIDELLGMVDLVREVPPNERTEDARTWGPYPIDDAPGFLIRMVSERQGLGQFTWAFETSPEGADDWSPAFWGIHDAGVTVAEGIGSFVFDGDAVAAIGEPTEAGDSYLVANYDNRDGNQVELQVYESAIATEPLGTYLYDIEPDQAGTFAFATDMADFVDGKDFEAYEVTTTWVPDLGGRGDATVSGGDLEPLVGNEPVYLLQCWSAEGVLLHQADDHGISEPVGSAENCIEPP